MDTAPNEIPSPRAAGPGLRSSTTRTGLGGARRGQPGRGHSDWRACTGSAGAACSAGVAVGLADYFDVDPTLVRIGFVALAFLGGLAVPLYLAGWLLIPDEDSDLSVAEELLARERARSAY